MRMMLFRNSVNVPPCTIDIVRLRGLETARVHGQFTEILETLLASVAKDGRARLMCTKAR